MTQKLIFQLIEVAIGLVQSQLESGNVASTLVRIIQRMAAAYEAQTGQPLDPLLIKPEAPL